MPKIINSAKNYKRSPEKTFALLDRDPPAPAHSLKGLILYKARWVGISKTWSSHESGRPAQRAKTFCSLTNQRAPRYSRVTNHGTDYPFFSWHFLFCLRFKRVLFRFEFRFSPPAKFYFNVRTFSSLYFRYRELVSHLFFFHNFSWWKNLSVKPNPSPVPSTPDPSKVGSGSLVWFGSITPLAYESTAFKQL